MPDEMERDNSIESNIHAQDTCYKSVTQGNIHDSNLPENSDLYDRHLEQDSSDSDDLMITQQLKQEVVYTNTDDIVKSHSGDMPLIAKTTSSHSNAGDLSHLGHSEQRAGQIDPLHYRNMEADNNKNDSNDLTGGANMGGKMISSSKLTEQDVLHKLQDTSVEKQFQVLTNIKEISQSDLSMLSRMNKADPSVKRLLARPRLTAKEVKEIFIDTDIEATVNEFLQTNMVGNFVMVRVLQENYCRFYSWLTAHLQVERDAWVARLKQALEKIEVNRKDCLVMKDVLATSTSRLHQLIRQLSFIMTETPSTEVNNEKSPVSGTLLSSNIQVFPCDSLACSQAGHEQAKVVYDAIKDQAHQPCPNKNCDSLDEISVDCSEHLDLTPISNTESVPLVCQTQSDSYIHRCCKDLARSRAHSIRCSPTKQCPSSSNNKKDTDCSLKDEKCANIGRTIASMDKEETDNDENDKVDWSQAINDNVDVLGRLCEELVRDHLACFRLLGICPNRCQSLQDALHVSMRDKGDRVQIKLKEVEKRVGSLEIENRQLVKEVKSLYSSLTQKANEVFNLQGQVERLEYELQGVGPRVAVSEALGTNSLAVNSQEINSTQANKLQRNSYQISMHERHNNQLNRRYSNHKSDTNNFSDGLNVAANRHIVSRTSHEMNNQGTRVEPTMAQSNKTIQGGLIKCQEKQCNGRDTTTETPCWPSSGKTLWEITKQGQRRLHLRASEGSISDGIQVAGTDLTDKRESQSKLLVETRVTTIPPACNNHRKKLIETHQNYHRQYTRFPLSDQGCTNSKSTSDHRIGETIGHEDLIQITSQSEQDGSHSSRWHEHNQRPAAARCISPNDIPNPCNSPESTESVIVTKPMLKPDHGQYLSNKNRVSMYKNSAQSTDDDISKKHDHCETRNTNSPESIESETVTKQTSTPSYKQVSNNDVIRKNNDHATDIGACIIGARKHNNHKCVTHSNLVSLISKQMSESMPVLSCPRQKRKSDVSKCLRCQNLFYSTENQKMACSYHRWG